MHKPTGSLINWVRTLVIAAVATAGLSSLAQDPFKDYQTMIYPSFVPKAGGTAPGNGAANAAGQIRLAYETYFENYWKETSYFEYDPVTGEKVRGFNMDTKTFGYVAMPWPVSKRGGGSDGSTGAGEPFNEAHLPDC